MNQAILGDYMLVLLPLNFRKDREPSPVLLAFQKGSRKPSPILFLILLKQQEW